MTSNTIAALLCLALLGCAENGATPGAGAGPEGRNVLLLTVDTLRADHMGCYGYERPTTPFLDSLAARSTLFRWGLVQWPKTGPSFASLFSSTYGSTSGIKQKTGTFEVPLHYDLLAECLKTAGYETLAVVTNSTLEQKLNYDQGFDVYRLEDDIASGSAERAVEVCKEVLEDRDRKRPFFLWAHFIDPHTPYTPPEKYRKMFFGDALYEKSPADPVPLYVDGQSKGPMSVGQIPPEAQRGNEDCTAPRDFVARYDGEVRYFDDTMASFFAWMESEGLLDDTLVVFTSDHGESLGDHEYYFEHGRYPYDNCVRVPLFIHHPDAPPGVIAEPVALLDLLPTILDALSLPHPEQVEGHSILSWVMNGRPDGEVRDVITESGYQDDFTVSLRRGPWKLIRVHNEGLLRELEEPYQLYHVEEDPLETHNLFAERPEVVAELKPVLDAEVARRHAREGVAEMLLNPTEEDIEQLRALGYLDDAADLEKSVVEEEVDGQ